MAPGQNLGNNPDFYSLTSQEQAVLLALYKQRSACNIWTIFKEIVQEAILEDYREGERRRATWGKEQEELIKKLPGRTSKETKQGIRLDKEKLLHEQRVDAHLRSRESLAALNRTNGIREAITFLKRQGFKDVPHYQKLRRIFKDMVVVGWIRDRGFEEGLKGELVGPFYLSEGARAAISKAQKETERASPPKIAPELVQLRARS